MQMISDAAKSRGGDESGDIREVTCSAKALERDFELVYSGSVKRLWKKGKCSNPVEQSESEINTLWFEFSDEYSIFDWGKMPDRVAGKGLALTLIGGFFFEYLGDRQCWHNLACELENCIEESKSSLLSRFEKAWLQERLQHPLLSAYCREGLNSHYQGLDVDGRIISLAEAQALRSSCGDMATTPESRILMAVESASVPRVERRVIDGRSIYFYKRDHSAVKSLIPLEVVFRFGMPSGSSLCATFERDPQYAAELGLSSRPAEGDWLERPVMELYTKLEPVDRRLGWSEAAQISGLTAREFDNLIESAYLIALALYLYFGERGLELWDGKLEFIHDSDGDTTRGASITGVRLADSIGPDELRLLYRGQHLSKELLRNIYRNSSWYRATNEAKKMAAQRKESDWQSICVNELGEKPRALAPEAKKLVDSLYGVLANHILACETFSGQAGIDDFLEKLSSLTSLKNEATRN